MSYGKVSQKIGRMIDDQFTNWLYGDYDEDKLARFEAYYSIPVVRQYIDYKLDRRADSEYMSRYGLSYSDIHDPRKLKQTSSGSRLIGSAVQLVSRNVSSLYDDPDDKKKKKS